MGGHGGGGARGWTHVKRVCQHSAESRGFPPTGKVDRVG